MIHYRYVDLSGFGTEYTFERAGEEIPEHQHASGQGHAVRCLSGRIRLHGEGLLEEIDPARGEVSFDGTTPHALTALVDHTVIFNRMQSPERYRHLLGTGGIA